jgi:hypothetical protein
MRFSRSATVSLSQAMLAHAHRENALGLDEFVPHGIAHKFSG